MRRSCVPSITLLSGALLAAMVLWSWPVSGQAPQLEARAGAWMKVSSSGMLSYSTTSGSGSHLSLACDFARTADHGATRISLQLNGRVLPSHAEIIFDVDGERLTIPSDKAGGVETRDCAECARKFAELWTLVRNGRRIAVTAADGNSAIFSLNGTAKLMPEKACPTASGSGKQSAQSAEGAIAGDTAGVNSFADLVVFDVRGACGVLRPRDAGFATRDGADTAGGRVALVVGMAAYANGIPPLRNPITDIASVSHSLLKLGFTIYYVADGTASAVLNCAKRAQLEMAGADVALFYYAGHGVQIEDENFLIATDADLAGDRKTGFVSINAVAERLRADAGTTLIFLDACRDNPFVVDGQAGLSPSTGRGLAGQAGGGNGTNGTKGAQARGVLVAYSTSPNAVAQDGDGNRSAFAAAFARHITEPGFSVQRVMSQVANAVGEATNWTQTPWTRSSLTGELKLAGPMTMKEAQAVSENWARRARELLERGRRKEAIAAALKGIPAGTPEDAAKHIFAPAYAELVRAYLSGNAPASAQLAAVPGRLLHGVWISPDRSRYVAAYNVNNTEVDLALYSAYDGARIATLIDNYRSDNFLTMVTFSHDGRRVAAAFDNGLTVWNADNGSRVAHAGKAALMRANFAFSPAKTRLMSEKMYGASEAGVVDAKTGRELARFTPTDLAGKNSHLAQFVNSQRSVKMHVNFINDRTLCVAVAGGMTPQTTLPVAMGIYDIEKHSFAFSGVLMANEASFLQGVYCSQDGRWAAVAAAVEGTPTTLRVWDFQTGRKHARIETGSDGARSMFDPTSRYLAIDIHEGAAIYDLRKRSFLLRQIGEGSASSPGVFSPDGERLGGNGGVPPAYIWALMPDGTDVIQAASGLLPKELTASVAAERVEFRQSY